MLKLNLGWVTVKTEPMEKFWKLNQQKIHISSFPSVNGNGISAFAIMKKLKNGCHFVNIDHMEKCQITNPPKDWISGFLSVNGNWISVLAIKKKLKNGCHLNNINCTEKCPISDPPQKIGSPVFQVLTKMEYQCQPLWKNWKMAAILLISIVQKNFKLPTTPKFGSLVFQVLTETEYQHQPLWKNWKMAAISLISIVWKNFWFSFFPITHPRFHFNIYARLHLKHLCVDIYASLVYPTSHLCVVLYFLILIINYYKDQASRF